MKSICASNHKPRLWTKTMTIWDQIPTTDQCCPISFVHVSAHVFLHVFAYLAILWVYQCNLTPSFPCALKWPCDWKCRVHQLETDGYWTLCACGNFVVDLKPYPKTKHYKILSGDWIGRWGWVVCRVQTWTCWVGTWYITCRSYFNKQLHRTCISLSKVHVDPLYPLASCLDSMLKHLRTWLSFPPCTVAFHLLRLCWMSAWLEPLEVPFSSFIGVFIIWWSILSF